MSKSLNGDKYVKQFWNGVTRKTANEIVSSKPGTLSRWIFPLYGLIISGIIFTLWFIHHPEIVHAKAVLTGFNIAANTLSVDLDIPELELSKIDSGQSVQLRFNGYPRDEYGVVAASLQHKPILAANSRYMAQLALPQGLTTDQHKIIAYKEGSKASLLIIVKDMPLLQRIFTKTTKKSSPE